MHIVQTEMSERLLPSCTLTGISANVIPESRRIERIVSALRCAHAIEASQTVNRHLIVSIEALFSAGGNQVEGTQ